MDGLCPYFLCIFGGIFPAWITSLWDFAMDREIAPFFCKRRAGQMMEISNVYDLYDSTEPVQEISWI